MDLNENPSRNDRVIARRGDGSVILLDPDNGEYFTLDDVGGRIWELCDGTKTLSDIAHAVADEYDAPIEQIRADVTELLEELRASNLLRT